MRELEENRRIVKKKLHEQVYEVLKQDILEHRIGFGEKLTNSDLQEHYDVSSTPVRDAINRLYLEGLLDEISQGGARVVSFDYTRAIEANELMFILNKEAVTLMAERADPKKVIPKMDMVLKQQPENLNSELYSQYDFQFHHIFFDFCGNSQFMHLYSQYSGIWQMLIKFYHSGNASRSKAVSQHGKMLNAYKTRNIALLQSLIKEHFDDATKGLGKMLQRPEDGFVKCDRKDLTMQKL